MSLGTQRPLANDVGLYLCWQEQSAADLLERLDLEEEQLHALTADLRRSLTPSSTPPQVTSGPSARHRRQAGDLN